MDDGISDRNPAEKSDTGKRYCRWERPGKRAGADINFPLAIMRNAPVAGRKPERSTTPASLMLTVYEVSRTIWLAGMQLHFIRSQEEAEIPLIMPPEYTMKDSDDGTEYRLQRAKIH